MSRGQASATQKSGEKIVYQSSRCGSLGSFDLNIGKDGLLDGIRIACANPYSDVNGVSHNERYGGSRNHRLARLPREGRELIAPTLNSETGRAMLSERVSSVLPPMTVRN